MLAAGLLAFLLFVGTTLPALSEERIALLIGNQAYAKAVGPLRNPVNDVNLIAASLRKIGFSNKNIRIVKNGRRRDVLSAVDAHARALREAGPGAIGFFYYSGHGVANRSDRRNYLIPVGVGRLDASVWYDAISLDRIVSRLSDIAGDAAHFVVFDACRNLLNMTSKGGKGFVPVSSRRGMLIAFSTDPGETASDDGERSGPYATALAAEITKPGLDHLDLFQNVKETVHRKTKVQLPWTRDGLVQRVYLSGKARPTTPPKPVLPRFDSNQADLVFWTSVKDTNDPVMMRAYLRRYPNGIYAPIAKRLLSKLEKQAEKETEARIRQEQLRLAEAKQRKAEAARREAERKARFAKQAEELRRARDEAKLARQQAEAAKLERQAALRAADQAKAESLQAEEAAREAQAKAEQDAKAATAVSTKAAEEVLRAKQALRLVEKERADALKAAAQAKAAREKLLRAEKPKEPQVKTAALSPANPSNNVSGPPKVPADKGEGSGEVGRAEIAKQAQTELKRLGCYRGTADGLWGPGSRSALKQYARLTKSKYATVEPSQDMLSELRLRKTRVCPVTPRSRSKERQSPKKPPRRTVRRAKKKCMTYAQCVSWCSGADILSKGAAYCGQACSGSSLQGRELCQ